MSSEWQQLNRQWFIPLFSSLTLFRRRLSRPLHQWIRKVEREHWLTHPANMGFEQRLRHWVTVGPRRYESGVVTTDREGRLSAFLRSTNVSAYALATLRQTIKADQYRGKQLRFSGEVKVEQVEEQAGLYMRTSAQPVSERLRPENVARGTHDWMRYEVTISVPQDAHFVRFGLVLSGIGQVWLANTHLEVVEAGGL